MKKCLFVLSVFFILFCSTARSETKVFQLSVTIPATAYLNVQQNNKNQLFNQLPQTQEIYREDKMMAVTSIVVP